MLTPSVFLVFQLSSVAFVASMSSQTGLIVSIPLFVNALQCAHIFYAGVARGLAVREIDTTQPNLEDMGAKASEPT